MLWVGSFHYSIDSYKIFLRMHCFGYPELIFPLKTSFPIVPFRFLETNVWWSQSYYAMNVPLTLIIFFAKVTTLFLKWKRISLLSRNQSYYAMNVPLTLIIFFAKVTTLFLKWKRISLLSRNQSYYAMNVPLTLIIFFAKVTTLFLKWKRISLFSNS